MPTAMIWPRGRAAREHNVAGGLRQRLRHATAAAHKRIDGLFGALDLTRFAGYRHYLETMAAALVPLEAALAEAGVARAFPDWLRRYRSAAILEDLAAVGGDFAPLPQPKPLDAGALLGSMYVLEGSRLGGAVLLSTVKASPDPRVVGATAFLRHGEGLKLWPTFLVELERQAASLDSDATAIAGALRAFGLFEQAAARLPTAPVEEMAVA